MKKSALVTGGTRGIGWGIAKALAEEGYDLGLCGVRPESQVRDILERLRGRTSVHYWSTDIGSPEQRERLARGIRGAFDSLNLLVNNAGIAPRERLDLLDTSPESFHEVMRVNLEGPFFLTQALAGWMIECKEQDSTLSSTIINITSISAVAASVSRGEYCISKAGLSMMSRLFAVRLSEFDIPVFEIRPGLVQTDMTEGVSEEYDRLIEEGLLLQKRWGQPEDIGQAVVALAEGKLPYATGQILTLDGGMLIPRL